MGANIQGAHRKLDRPLNGADDTSPSRRSTAAQRLRAAFLLRQPPNPCARRSVSIKAEAPYCGVTLTDRPKCEVGARVREGEDEWTDLMRSAVSGDGAAY